MFMTVSNYRISMSIAYLVMSCSSEGQEYLQRYLFLNIIIIGEEGVKYNNTLADMYAESRKQFDLPTILI